MSVPRRVTADLPHRVAAFAALADPSRLQIVDLLTVGDLSPSEIMSSLSLSSNLVAFHLGVLEERGIVRRSRSEADGRRSYARLMPDAFLTLAPQPVPVAGRVVFVCTANSARSQLAEALWAEVSDIPAISAGTEPGNAVHPGAVAAAERFGFTLSPDARPKELDAVRRPGDYLISVCNRAHEQLSGQDDGHWSIADPAEAATPEAFDAVVRELRERIARVSPRLVAA